MATESDNAKIDFEILTLGEVLKKIRSFKWNYALFIGGDSPFNDNSPCAVLDPNDSDDPDIDPDFARQHGLTYVLSVQDARGVVENAESQKAEVDLQDIVKAFNYYYENDAFILF